jgi:hypothetical protein
LIGGLVRGSGVSQGSLVGGAIFGTLVGAAAIVWGVYLLRGKGPTTKIVAAKAQAANDYEGAIGRLHAELAQGPTPRAALVTALIGAQIAGSRRFGATAPQELGAEFARMGFDPMTLNASIVGQVPGISMYPHWIIAGNAAYDLSAAARATFHLDDQVRTVTTTDKRGVSTSVEVPRGGQLRVMTPEWSLAFPVASNYVPAARHIADQINYRAEQLREHTSTAAIHQSSVEVEQIRAITNPETAQALQNLQNLLYTRVITDEEFASMKAKLLAGPAGR